MPLFVFLCGAHSGADIEQYSLRREGSEIWTTFGRQFESETENTKFRHRENESPTNVRFWPKADIQIAKS